MAPSQSGDRVRPEEIAEGDDVTVHVNDRASEHLGTDTFDATVTDALGASITFEPVEQLQEGYDTHTWYADIGYIHGHHTGLGRYSDIGRVVSVTRR